MYRYDPAKPLKRLHGLSRAEYITAQEELVHLAKVMEFRERPVIAKNLSDIALNQSALLGYVKALGERITVASTSDESGTCEATPSCMSGIDLSILADVATRTVASDEQIA